MYFNYTNPSYDIDITKTLDLIIIKIHYTQEKILELRNYVNGKFVESLSKKDIPVINPANQEIVGCIDEALDEEIELALIMFNISQTLV